MFFQLLLCDVVNNFAPVKVWFGVSTCTKSALHPVKNMRVTAFCSPDHSLQKEVTHTFYGVESAFWRNTTLSVPPLYVCGGADACSPALFNMAVFAGWVFGLLLTLHSLVSSLVLVFDPSFFGGAPVQAGLELDAVRPERVPADIKSFATNSRGRTGTYTHARVAGFETR